MTPRNLSIPQAVDLTYVDLDCVPSTDAHTVLGWLTTSASYGSMTGLPMTAPPMDGDVYRTECTWLARAFSAYLNWRAKATVAARTTIDAWFLANAQFAAAQSDAGLLNIWPKRMTDDYSVAAGPAAEGDMLTTIPEGGGSTILYQGGLPISHLSQYYNNRRAYVYLFVAWVGFALGNDALVQSAQRYVREWVMFCVWPNGAQGEWARNGDYGWVNAGLPYGAANISAALYTAMWGDTYRGDVSLLKFATNSGRFGTEAPAGQPKTIWTAFDMHVSLLNGSTVLCDQRGVPFSPITDPVGRQMHASWYLPVARRYYRSAALDQWAKGYVSGPYDDPFGLWRGMSGISRDVRNS